MNILSIKNQTYKTIASFAIPSVIAMVLSSMANIVDGIFLTNFVSQTALVSTQLGLPILYLFLGLAIMIGVGGVTIASRRLGMKNLSAANNVFRQTVATLLILLLLVAVTLYILLPTIAKQTISSEIIRSSFLSYYQIMIVTFIANMLMIVMGMFIRGAGLPQKFMILSVLSNIINLLLDYLFIVQLNFGIQGAAWASLIAYTFACIMAIKYLMLTPFSLGTFKFSLSDNKSIFTNGSSELIGQWAMMITTLLFNSVVLRSMGNNGLLATTIVGYTGYVFTMMIVGIGQGVSPLMSFSLGSGDISLCKRLRRCSIIIVIVISILVTSLCWILSSWYGLIFSTSATLLPMITFGIKVYSIGFLFSSINILMSFAYTSLGKAKESAIISASRGLVILALAILVLPILLGAQGVWFVYPSTEFLTLIITYTLYRKETINEPNLQQ